MAAEAPTTVQERIGRVVDVAQTAGWTTKAYRRGSGFALRCLKGDAAFLVWFGPKGSINLAWRCEAREVPVQIQNGPGSPRSWENVIKGGKDIVLRELRKGVMTHG